MARTAETLFEDWNQAVARVLDNGPAQQDFHDLVATILAFDVLMVFEYSPGKARAVWHNVTGNRRKVIIDDYLLGPFLLDPFYTRAMSSPDPGLMVMRQLSPDQFHKSEFFRKHYHLTEIADEIGIAFEVNPGSVTVASITRPKRQMRFTPRERKRFENAAPLLAALGRKLWQRNSPTVGTSGTRQIEHALKGFCGDVLSRREVEIVSLILKGHSSVSTGEVLGITPGTVKIHRKNIYAKLGISSQAELFNRFIRYISKT
ncbi:MAG: helix-turn-helix transcriptional regulator [Nitratireductor sp.]|nr:helix-turn-helix transcriptional regulator [Nitratireductor sp.]